MKDPIRFEQFSDSATMTYTSRSIKGGCYMTKTAMKTDGVILRSPERPSAKHSITGLRIVRNK